MVISTMNYNRMAYNSSHMEGSSLNKKIIKHLHYLLKSKTSSKILSWFNVGECKSHPI